MSSRIALGIVGLGTDWADAVGPRIVANPRVRVGSVYDFSLTQMIATAKELAVRPSGAIRPLLGHRALRALVCCSLGWRSRLIEELVDSGKPVFLSERALDALPQNLGPLLDRIDACGAIVCPDLSWRYTPATLRLRELMAVRLGPCVEIRISVPDSQPKLLPAMLDWCRVLTGGRECRVPTRTGNALYVDLDRAVARITCHAAEPIGDAPAAPTAPNWIIQCERGVAILRGEQEIEWSTGDESHVESLADERSRLDVNLDLFFRRVVGGLVPAPTLLDLQMARTALRGLESSSADRR